jgi:hypothetical protein
MESREQAQEGGREILVGSLEPESHMAETKAGGGIQDGKAAASPSRGVMAAATLLGGRLGQGFGVAPPWLGQLFGRQKPLAQNRDVGRERKEWRDKLAATGSMASRVECHYGGATDCAGY